MPRDIGNYSQEIEKLIRNLEALKATGTDVKGVTDELIESLKRGLTGLSTLKQGPQEFADAFAVLQKTLTQILVGLDQIGSRTENVQRLANTLKDLALQAYNIRGAIRTGEGPLGGPAVLGEPNPASVNLIHPRATGRGIVEQPISQELVNSLKQFADATKRPELKPLVEDIKATGKAAKEVTTPVEDLRTKLLSVGASLESVGKIITQIGFFGGETRISGVSELKKRYTVDDQEFRELSVRYKNVAGVSQSLRLFIDEAGNLLTELPKRVIPELKPLEQETKELVGPFMQLAKSLIDVGVSATDAIKIIQGLSARGRVPTGTRLAEAGAPIERDGEIYRHYRQTVEGASGVQEKFNFWVSETGKVFINIPPKVQKATQAVKEYTEEQKRSLQQRLPEAFTLAAQKGFRPETLKEVRQEGAQGIIRVSFAYRDQEGALRKLTVTTDQFGRVLQDSQKRFRTFASALTRNIGEVFKWAIAVSVVYAPLKALNDLTRLSIENQSKLADISITLGISQEKLGKVFKQAADASRATGESLDGVLAGYELAFRATGSITNETERYRVANQLLVDSLVLAKVSGLDQATSLDTLSGALKQMNLPLDQGVILLDKWVAVSKVANVSTKTLAESFAITASSAENAGLSIDEINGIIATVAEVTTLSATESGNAVRAFISGFQTDKARSELTKLGVAVEDSTGKARPFLDVMEDLRGLFDAGIIDETQLNRAGEALGGGARRGAQYVAFLTNLGRVTQVANASAGASGDAYDALGTKLETVQAAVTNLGSAFQELAQTLGTEGGILDVITIMIKGATQLVDVLNKLVEVTGRALPLLVALGIARATLTASERANLAGRLGFATRPTPALEGAESLVRTAGAETVAGIGIGAAGLGSPAVIETTGRKIGLSISDTMKSRASGIGIALGLTALTAVTDDRDWEDTGITLATSIGGALIAGPYGAVFGSAIGEAIVQFINQAYAAEGFGFEDAFKTDAEKRTELEATYQERLDAAKTPEERREILQEQFDEQLVSAIGSKLGTSFLTAISQGAGAIGGGFKQERGLAGLTGLGLKIAYATPERAAELQPLLDDLIRITQQIREIDQEIEDTGQETEDFVTPLIRERKRFLDENRAILSQLQEDEERYLRESFSKGEITARALKDGLEGLSGTSSILAQAFTVLNDELELTPGLFQAIARQAPEEFQELEIQLSEIETYLENIEKIRLGEIVGQEAIDLLSQYSDMTQRIIDQTAYIQGIQQRTAAAQFREARPEIVDIDLERSEFERYVLPRARAEQKAISDLQIEMGLSTAEQAAAYEASIKPLWVRLADGSIIQIERIEKEFLSLGEAGAQAAGQIGRALGFQTYDITSAELATLLSQVEPYVRNVINPALPPGRQYKLDKEEQIAITRDGVMFIHTDLQILNLLMRDLIDVNKQQLEGIYNLPTDATFYVPYTGLQYLTREGGLRQMFQDAAGEGAEDAAEETNRLFKRGDFGERLRELKEQVQLQITLPPDLETLLKLNTDLISKRLQKEDGAITRGEIPPEEFTGLFERMANTIEEFLTNIGRFSTGRFGETPEGLQGAPKTFGRPTEAEIPPISTQLQLEIKQTTQLNLDGRLIASHIQQYISDQLVKFEGSQGGAVVTQAI